MCADHAGDKIPFIYIYLQIELRNAAMHLAMWESHACFAQEGAAKQTRTSICLGKPGFRDRPTNPCVLQVSDKTRRRSAIQAGL